MELAIFIAESLELRESGCCENNEEKRDSMHHLLDSLSKLGLAAFLIGHRIPSFFKGKAYIAFLLQKKCAHNVFSNVNIGIGTGPKITSQTWHLWDLVKKVLFISAGRILKFSPKQLEML